MEAPMQERIITLATPVFFLLILIELIVGLLRGRNTYRLSDAINSLSLGVLSQISAVFMQLLRIGLYAWLVQRVALFELPSDRLWVWLSGVLLYDLCYYWHHRMGHEVNLLWAAHVVHHQSEDYNLSTALRQTSSGALLGWVFYVPMALLGYPVEVFAAVALIDLLYQFWVHTQQIGKLGWLDRVFVTPSNHRVHHAVNDVYLDKNYGGILILWDRLFGTFIEERDAEPVIFGTRSPLRSWNPLWANFEVYKSIWSDAWHAQRFADKLRIWFARPDWRPADVVAAWPKPSFNINRPIFDPRLAKSQQFYGMLQFTIILLATTHFLTAHQAMTTAHSVTYAVWLGAGLWIIGGLLEHRAGYIALEMVRLAVTAIAVLFSGSWFGPVSLPLWAQATAAVLAIGSIALLWAISKTYSTTHGYSCNQ
jgi:alkylglycerol monooxygenase